MTLVIFIIIVLLVIVPALLLLARRHRERAARDEVSPITRQHIELFQGGTLNETAVEAAKARFRALLERGEADAVERSLRGGIHFVVQVRALAELGTEDAGRILERQLRRRLSDDAVEQAWYWIDLASGLRSLNRSQSLPHLLAAAEQAGDQPLSHFLAAETVCFLGFAGYVRQAQPLWAGPPCACSCARSRGCATACRLPWWPRAAWANWSRRCGTTGRRRSIPWP